MKEVVNLWLLELACVPSSSCEAHGAGVDAHVDGGDVESVSSVGCSDVVPPMDKPAKDNIMGCGGPLELVEPELAPCPRGHCFLRCSSLPQL